MVNCIYIYLAQFVLENLIVWKIYCQSVKTKFIYKKNLSKFTVLAISKLTDIQILIYITSYQKVVRRQKVENQLSPMKAHTNLLIHHGKLYLYSLVYLYQ